jgi:hypothetical protein
MNSFIICKPKLVVVDPTLLKNASTALSNTLGLESTEIVLLGSSASSKFAQVCES